jgi:H+/Cl- antiporter ClcA
LASCVLYGVYIAFYVFELVFYGFPLPFAISVRLNEGVIYNTVGLFLMVFASLVVRWRMKHWRLKRKWWATEPPP